ncbi:MAG TPA: PilN domain-containing protein [Nitrospiria bacterium]|nr:PilN domain-containing protein [Nitrospiria bacterium]
MKREINLITDEFFFDPEARFKRIVLAGWLFCLIGLLGGMMISKGFEIKRKNLEIVQLQGHLAQLSKEEADLTEFTQKNGQVNDEGSFQDSIRWVEILSTIGSIVPEGAWLKGFDGGITKEGKDQPAVKQIKLTGFASSHAPITLLLSRLERQSIFSQIRLVYTEKKEMPEDHFVHFEMTGRLN